MTKKVSNTEKRSREGCIICRQRRVKCDEKKPYCLNCLRLNHKCSYNLQLKWEDQMLKRGLVFGRSDVSRKKVKRMLNRSKEVNLVDYLSHQIGLSVPSKLNFPFLNTTIKDLSIVYKIKDVILVQRHEEKYDQVTSFDDTRINPSWISDQSFLQTDQLLIVKELGGFSFGYDIIEYNLFYYFVTKICPVCICCSLKNELIVGGENFTQPNKINPYLNFIVPMAIKSEILFKTVVAVSANELSIELNSDFYGNIARSYMFCVLKEVPKLFKNNTLSNWNEILATLVMLCFADISSNCGHLWILHLSGGKEFLMYLLSTQGGNALSAFVARYFISHEVMGRTAWSNQQVDTGWKPYFKHLEYDDDKNIDLVLGCCPCLISIINDISQLGSFTESLDFGIHKTRHSFISNILEQRDNLEFKLINLDQVLVVEEAVDSSENVKQIAKVKQIAAIIYLYARVDQELYYNLGNEYRKEYRQRSQTIKPWILHAVHLMEGINTPSMSLLWPLFIVGIVSYDNEDHRHFVLLRLQAMENSRKLASVSMAKQTIEILWKERDLGCGILKWVEIMRGRADTISLA